MVCTNVVVSVAGGGKANVPALVDVIAATVGTSDANALVGLENGIPELRHIGTSATTPTVPAGRVETYPL